GLAPRILRVRRTQTAEHDPLAIRHPPERAIVEVAARHLARRAAAVGRQDENVRAAILDVALPIAPIVQLLHDARWLDPLRALWRRWHRDVPAGASGDEDGTREPLLV